MSMVFLITKGSVQFFFLMQYEDEIHKLKNLRKFVRSIRGVCWSRQLGIHGCLFPTVYIIVYSEVLLFNLFM